MSINILIADLKKFHQIVGMVGPEVRSFFIGRPQADLRAGESVYRTLEDMKSLLCGSQEFSACLVRVRCDMVAGQDL